MPLPDDAEKDHKAKESGGVVLNPDEFWKSSTFCFFVFFSDRLLSVRLIVIVT